MIRALESTDSVRRLVWSVRDFHRPKEESLSVGEQSQPVEGSASNLTTLLPLALIH